MRTLSRTRPVMPVSRTILAVILLLAVNPLGHAEQQNKVEFPDRPELLRRIARFEAAAQQAEATHSPGEHLVEVYLSLGAMYEDVAMYPRSEATINRAIALLHGGPESELASATGDLAMLHLVMNELRQAEREEQDALRLREKTGDPVAIAESWKDLAQIYLQQRQYKKAEEFAQKAMDVFGHDSRIDPVDRIGVEFTIARALCANRECGRAIPILNDTIELAKATFGDDAVPVGYGYYLLGYSYWKTGDPAAAAEWMHRGTTQMKGVLGWGHPIYLDSLKQYATFLRERGQMVAALAVDHEVHQAETVVDVRTLTAPPGVLGFAGAR